MGAGQERFRTITSAYYRGADGIIMVYDVTRNDSFEHVQDWLNEVNRYANQGLCKKLLIGNKCDRNDRVVSSEDGQQCAAKLGVPFFRDQRQSRNQRGRRIPHHGTAFDRSKDARVEINKIPGLERR